MSQGNCPEFKYAGKQVRGESAGFTLDVRDRYGGESRAWSLNQTWI